MFFWNCLAVLMIQQMLAFDLQFLCLFLIKLKDLDSHSSHTLEAWLGDFEHYFASM